MDTERTTERTDGVTTERTVERGNVGGTTIVERRGGMGGILIGIAVLALVAIVAFFLMNANKNDAMRTEAVSGAASSVAESAAGAAESVGNAASNAADAVTPNR
ncbi:hypothetical protein [Phenylobacterium sp.]|uniref:hypothetical protein n=1 Tax=Phenylobacterium sp. TaxID=1871053 RepID=UPI0039834819